MRHSIHSWIGRQGQGAQAWTSYWFTPKSKLEVNFRHQRVSAEFIPDGRNCPMLANTAQTNGTASLGFVFWLGHRSNHKKEEFIVGG